MLAARADALTAHRDRRGPARDLRRRPSRCSPRTTALRAKVLAAPARVLAVYGSYDEAQAVGLDALALAERLDLHELASDVITTLSELKKAGPKDALRDGAASRRSTARCEAGAIHAELRGRYLLGRSYQDWARVGRRPSIWFRSAMKAADGARASPWAPYALRVAVAAGLDQAASRGDWDEVLALTDTCGEQSRRRSPAPMFAALRAESRGPRRDRSAEGRARCGRSGSSRAGSPSTRRRRDRARRTPRRRPRRGDREVYDAVVAALGRIWHEWFSARIRLAAIAIGAVADAHAAASRAPTRAALLPRRRAAARRRAHACSTSTPTRPATGVPRAGPG